MASPRRPRHFIQSVARGLTVLQVFSAQRPRLTLQEISQLTGFNMTTVQRITDTLQTLGFLGRDENLRFHLEPKVLSLGYTYFRGEELPQLGETKVKEFAILINHTVNLAILDDLEIIFIYRHEIKRFLQFKLYRGSRLPSYCTSNGKVLLAALEDDDLMERIKRMNLEALTRYTKTDAQELLEDIYNIRTLGYGISDQELSLDVVSAAVPLIDHHGQTVAALNISMTPTEAHSGNFRELVEKLKAEGRRLSVLLGYQGTYPSWPGPQKNKPKDSPMAAKR